MNEERWTDNKNIRGRRITLLPDERQREVKKGGIVWDMNKEKEWGGRQTIIRNAQSGWYQCDYFVGYYDQQLPTWMTPNLQANLQAIILIIFYLSSWKYNKGKTIITSQNIFYII